MTGLTADSATVSDMLWLKHACEKKKTQERQHEEKSHLSNSRFKFESYIQTHSMQSSSSS